MGRQASPAEEAGEHGVGAERLRRVVEHALAGDREAAAELYGRYHAVVLAMHLVHCQGDQQLAADLTQDTFVKVLYRLDRFEWRGPGSLRGWVATVARNTFRDHVRAAAQRHHGGYDVPDAPDEDGTGDPASMAERDLPGVRAETDRLLDNLKPEHRLVLTRMLGDGATAAEVASELGRSEAAVHQLKRRALDAARRALSPAQLEGQVT